MNELMITMAYIIITVFLYQLFTVIQKKLAVIWLHPMLLTIFVLIPVMLWQDISFNQYFLNTKLLSDLLEPAVVALGYPLYQHLKAIKYHWKLFLTVLSLGVLVVIAVSIIVAMLLINLPEIAISLSYKSVTTPIGIALTEASGGNNSITAFSIILAGLFGAVLGPTWLNFINVKSAKAQGLAIGAASHALGTATISKISYEHGAYGSLALIVSSVITALIGPTFVSVLLKFFL